MFRKFGQYIVNLGVGEADDFHERRKTQTTNYLLAFLLVGNMMNAYLFGIHYYQKILLVDALSSIAFSLIGFALQYFQIRKPLRHFMICAVLVSVMNIGIQFGSVTGIHFFLLYLVIITFLLLDNWWLIAFYTLVMVACFLVYDLKFANSPLHPDPNLAFAYLPNYLASVFALVLVLVHHKSETSDYQKIVEVQNKDMAHLNMELMFQKDSVLMASNKLEQRRKLVEHQNTSILESLRLASLVQQESLPPPESLFHGLADGFLWYKAKDMVSGDFYWAKGTAEGLLVLVADCVGHGVPGGMMAVLSSNLISQIVDEQGISQPGLILRELDSRLRRRIKQEHSHDLVDGMDIAICLIKPEHILFSSASRKLVKMNKGGGLELFKGNRHQLATIRQTSQGFEQVEISTRKGDRFYMFTDGVPDQLGGIDGLRFGSRQLLDTLTDIQHLAMSLQKTYLERKIGRWQGSEKQTDDMLMIGFEI